jgi:antitoxin YobK
MALDGGYAAGPATEDLIVGAERRLGLIFPRSYRWFLLNYGAVIARGFWVAGVFHAEDEPPAWSNVVTYTNQLRRASSGELPETYVAISDDGGDFKFYLDTARSSHAEECPVVMLGPGADEVPVAEDFFEFIVRASRGELPF